MTAAELDAMVGEIVSLLNLQPMTALGLTTLDPDTFWQVMRRVQARLARVKESKDENSSSLQRR